VSEVVFDLTADFDGQVVLEVVLQLGKELVAANHDPII
jgi:hypothetical protein